jgi:hypothetical protein
LSGLIRSPSLHTGIFDKTARHLERRLSQSKLH